MSAPRGASGSKKRKRNQEDTSGQDESPVPDATLSAFAELVAKRAEVFAGMPGGVNVADEALSVVKSLFDQSLTAEAGFLEQAAQLLSQLTDFGVQTRARSRRRRSKAKEPAKENPLLLPTPLVELVTADMPDEQIWEQLDMRAGKLYGLVSSLMSGGQETAAILDKDEVQEMDVDELDGAGLEDSDEVEMDNDDDSDYDEFGMDDTKDESSDEEQEPSDLEISYTSLNDSKRSPARLKRQALEASAQGPESPTRSVNRKPASAVDDEFFSLESFLRDAREGETQMKRAMSGQEPSSDDDEEIDMEDEIDWFAPLPEDNEDEEADGEGMDLGETADIGYDDFFDPPSKSSSKRSRSSLATPKPMPEADASSNRRVSFSEQVMVKPIASRKGTTSFAALAKQNGLKGALAMLDQGRGDDQESPFTDNLSESEGSDDSTEHQEPEEKEEGEDEDIESEGGSDEAIEQEELEAGEFSDGDSSEEGDDQISQEGDEAIRDLRKDLFAEDDGEAVEADQDSQNESRHEKRLKALKRQIAQLEAENVAEREWTMKGEVSSKQRPVNSLLEQDLEFENVAKTVPQVTAEVTASLEERIKKRILEDNYDDVVRRRPFDPAAYLPSRLLDISATQSDKSLAELYADEFSTERQRAEGKDVIHPADARLEKEHKEIEQLYEDLCARLDALSNARFTPKAPQTVITTVSNAPAVSLETALPTTQTATTLLAPEEAYAPQNGVNNGAAKEELTPTEKKTVRQRKKRHHAARQKQAGNLAGAKRATSAKAQKQEALTKLVGTRGVTVIGKAKAGQNVQKAQKSIDQRGSAALKL